MSSLIPRLSFEELRPDLAEMLRPRVERLGYLGESFKCAGSQPQALMSFMQFTEDLKHALPDGLAEGGRKRRIVGRGNSGSETDAGRDRTSRSQHQCRA